MTMDPRDTHGSNLRNELVTQIRARFGDLLGPHAALLDDEEGLEELAFRIQCGELGPLP